VKEFQKHFLLGMGVLFFACLLALAGYGLKFKSEIDGMKPVATGELTAGICAVKDAYVNLFLVKTKDGWIAIDSGIHSDEVAAQMHTLKISPESVKAVLLTHSDSDHTGAVKLFPNATVFLTKQEEPLVNGRQFRSFPFHNHLSVAYHVLASGQLLNIDGRSIKVILVPGHTPGSAVYVVDGKYLFAGDSMSIQNGHVEPFNRFFNMDSVQQVRNIPKLARLKGIQEIFTAHYGVSKEFVKAFELWPTTTVDSSTMAD